MLTIDTFRNEPNVVGVGVGVGAGEVIFRDGEAGSEMFAIVEGTVDIHKNGKCITSLQALEVFGEMAPIDGKRYLRANSPIRFACELKNPS